MCGSLAVSSDARHLLHPAFIPALRAPQCSQPLSTPPAAVTTCTAHGSGICGTCHTAAAALQACGLSSSSRSPLAGACAPPHQPAHACARASQAPRGECATRRSHLAQTPLHVYGTYSFTYTRRFKPIRTDLLLDECYTRRGCTTLLGTGRGGGGGGLIPASASCCRMVPIRSPRDELTSLPVSLPPLHTRAAEPSCTALQLTRGCLLPHLWCGAALCVRPPAHTHM